MSYSLWISNYIYNKIKTEIDFQMRLVDLDFCQYVKVKLRDKSYQHIGNQFKSVLSLEDIKEILFSGGRKSQHPNVKRKSNLAEWKENATTIKTFDQRSF